MPAKQRRDVWRWHQEERFFLDEIGNLSLPMQAKLLTAIEKRQISRLGATDIIPIDVRLISATNVNIRELVEEGNFRQDLLYRINTIEITIPPLRERGEDVLLLADYFLQRYTHKYKKEINGLSREAKQNSCVTIGRVMSANCSMP